jgi:hypothetical protein
MLRQTNEEIQRLVPVSPACVHMCTMTFQKSINSVAHICILRSLKLVEELGAKHGIEILSHSIAHLLDLP